MRSSPLVLLCLALAAGCSDSGSDNAYNVKAAGNAVSGTTPIAVGNEWYVYMASEAFTGPGGTDLNGDGDTNDDVAVAGKLGKPREEVLGVIAIEAILVRNQVYLYVDEAQDGTDWNGVNGATDRVLLHWSDKDPLSLVDTFDPATALIAFVNTGDRLYYSSVAGPLTADGSSLRYVRREDATSPVEVMNPSGSGTSLPILHGEQDDMIFLTRDETREGQDLNGDGDAGDPYVLALLDGKERDAELVAVPVALSGPLTPFDAKERDKGNDWLIGFLVDEADQGQGSLNDPALFAMPIVPPGCPADLDTNDEVLHYLYFDDFVAGNAVAENTGLTGTLRVVAEKRAVATLSDEGDVGCDLNGDLDLLDKVARWVPASTPIAPPIDRNNIHAVATAIPGGSLGIDGLEDNFVIVVSEAQDGRDHDGKAPDHDLFAQIDPDDGISSSWIFAHQGSKTSNGTGIFEDVDGDTVPDPGRGASEPYAGTSWFGPEQIDGRIGAVFLEEVPGTNPMVATINNNVDCGIRPKDFDVVDAIPTWLDFEVSGTVLDFDGVGFAVDRTNAGIVVAAGFAFFRVDEAADSWDYNEDGDMNDLVLLRNRTAGCKPRFMGTASAVLGPVIVHDEPRNGGGVYIADEVMAGKDINLDGDAVDLVPRHFSF